MGEKGAERHRSSNGSVSVKKGNVRVFKNSNLSLGQAGFRSLAASPVKTDVRGCHSPDPLVSGLKKGKTPTLSISPTMKRVPLEGGVSPKNITPSSSPSLGYHYAGAKFSEPPSPDSLPKPPTHWNMTSFADGSMDHFFEISHQLKMMLKVQA